MITIRRWFAAKMLAQMPESSSSSSSQGPSSSSSFSSNAAQDASPPNHDPMTTLATTSSSRSHRHRSRHHHCSNRRRRHHHHSSQGPSSSGRSRSSHSSSGLKLPPSSSSNDKSTILKFYYADEELNVITAELDSFDGRKDPVRCTNLVNQLRSAQDKVICLLFQLMDEWSCSRADRDYRLKFPDDLVAGGENGESLNGQIWFGAECLASGSNIMNHESESEQLRPMAKMLTNTLEQLRLELRHGIMDIDTSFFIFTHPHPRITSRLKDKLQSFDVLFSNFEYEYVKAMLPIKTADEIEKLHEVTVLFSEAVSYSLKKGLIAQSDLDECHPHVLIAIPRLAILYGLVHCLDSPIFRHRKDNLSTIFRPFHGLMHRIRELISALRPIEVEFLERMLTNEESALSPHPNPPPIPPTPQSLALNATSPTLNSFSDTCKVKNDNRRADDRLSANSPSVSSVSTVRTRVRSTDHFYGPYSQSYPQNHASSSVSPTSNRDSTSVHFRTPSVATRRRGDDSQDIDENEEVSNGGYNGMRASSSVKERTCSSSVGFSRMHRRRHSDPVESVHMDRRSEFIQEGNLTKDSSTSSLSLITTLKELRTRASGRMSLDPEHEHPRRNRHHQDVHDVSSVSALDDHRQSSISFLSPSPANVIDVQDDDVQVVIRHDDEVHDQVVSEESREDEALTSVTPNDVESMTNNQNNNHTSQPTSILKQNSVNNNCRKGITNRLSIVSSSCSSSSTSTSSSSPNDSVDSFELALAVAAKSSQYISPTTRQLLHRLFVTISGVADQLQSNSAADLRVILRYVFKMYTSPDTEEEVQEDDEDVFVEAGGETQRKKTDNSSTDDDVSVEEALEAREDNNQGSSTTTSGVTSPVTDPIDSVTNDDSRPQAEGSSTTTSPASSSPATPSDDSLATDPPLDSVDADSTLVDNHQEEPSLREVSLIPVINPSTTSRNRSSRVSFDIPSSPSDSEERDLLPALPVIPSEGIWQNSSEQEQLLIDLRDDNHQSNSSASSSNHVQPIYVRRKHRHTRTTTTGSHEEQTSVPPEFQQSLVLPSDNSISGLVEGGHLRSRNDGAAHSFSDGSSTHRNEGNLFPMPSSATETSSIGNYSRTPSSAGYFRSRINDEQRMLSQRRRVQSEGGHNCHGTASFSSDHSHPCSSTPGMMAPVWVPDDLVASCTSCDQTFTLLRRRHHCRSCGHIFCNQCSSHSLPLLQFGYNKPVRVCDRCFLALRSVQTSGQQEHPVFNPYSTSTPTLAPPDLGIEGPMTHVRDHVRDQTYHPILERQDRLHMQLLQQQQQLPAHLYHPSVIEYPHPSIFTTITTTPTQARMTTISMTPPLTSRQPPPPTHLLD